MNTTVAVISPNTRQSPNQVRAPHALQRLRLFTRVHNWVTDKANSVKITASRQDAEDDGFASGPVQHDLQGRADHHHREHPVQQQEDHGTRRRHRGDRRDEPPVGRCTLGAARGAATWTLGQTFSSTIAVTAAQPLTGGARSGRRFAADFQVSGPISGRGGGGQRPRLDLRRADHRPRARQCGHRDDCRQHHLHLLELAGDRAGRLLHAHPDERRRVTITWPAAVKFPGATAPVLTASGRDRLVFVSENAGTTIDGVVVGRRSHDRQGHMLAAGYEPPSYVGAASNSSNRAPCRCRGRRGRRTPMSWLPSSPSPSLPAPRRERRVAGPPSSMSTCRRGRRASPMPPTGGSREAARPSPSRQRRATRWWRASWRCARAMARRSRRRHQPIDLGERERRRTVRVGDRGQHPRHRSHDRP